MKTSAARRIGALHWDPVMCWRAVKKTPDRQMQSQKKYSKRKLAQARSGWCLSRRKNERVPTAIRRTHKPFALEEKAKFLGKGTTTDELIRLFLPSAASSRSPHLPAWAHRPVGGLL